MRRTPVGIVVFPDVEVLDFAGPFEVFSVTRLNEETRYSDSSPFDVFLVAETEDAVVGTRVQVDNARLIRWIREQAACARMVTSVCAGSLLLAQAGLLNGLRATTHWRSLDRMAQAFPSVSVERGQHVVDAGSVLTSAGISAGIDMALRVVARHHGESVARATARHMEYPYPETNERRILLPG